MDAANELTGYAWFMVNILGLPSQYNSLPMIVLAGLLFTVVIFLARGIPRFLAAFIYALAVIFAFLSMLQISAMASLLPEWMAANYVPPVIMAFATLVGAWLIYSVSFIPVIRAILDIGDRYYRSQEPANLKLGLLGTINAREGTIGTVLLIVIIVLSLMQVAISVRFNFWYRDLFNALQAKQAAAFWYQGVVVFIPLATVWVVAQMMQFGASFVLRIRWRSHLNRHYVASWLGKGRHYAMQLNSSGADNPDQRIADDLENYVLQTYQLSLQILSQAATLVSFVVVLWALSAGFTFPGTDVAVPGLLVWIALAYAAVGTWLTHLIGRPLIGLFFQKERVEADYRFSLARIREYGEQISLLGGEHAEGERLNNRFRAIIENFMAIAIRTIKLECFRLSFRQLNVIFPILLAAPYYFIGKLEFGQIQQTVDAFSNVQEALNFFILLYTSLAAYRAVVNRLITFETAMKRVSVEHQAQPAAALKTYEGRDVKLDRVTVRLPDGKVLMADVDLTFRRGEAMLVTGPSGSGKSTLFRTLAGIWPFSNGTIRVPENDDMMELPQRPYIPQGSLRDAVTYPAVSGSYSDAEIVDALKAAKLEQFATQLDDERLWSQTLSLGEQQRLAVARALLAKPDWLLLDEATAALDEQTESDIYRAIKERMPQTTIISIGHRSTLKAFHDRRVEVQKQGESTILADIAVKA